MSPTPRIQQTPKEIFRAIRIFFIAIATGAVIFAAIAVVIKKFLDFEMEQVDEDFATVIQYVVIAVAIGCCLAAFWTFKKSIDTAKETLISLTDKLNLYNAALVKYAALCEGPAIFGIIAFLLTGNYYFLIVTVAMLFVMLLKRPTKRRIVQDLELDWQQQQELE